jgi:ribulose-5-phosphate 4-epimerase/fuculose-1-phosphate aldolase
VTQLYHRSLIKLGHNGPQQLGFNGLPQNTSKGGEGSMAAGYCRELRELAELSAYLGRHELLVQASTGNTSVKIGRTLWIKASGKWLVNALSEEMFVPIDFADAGKYLSGELPRPNSTVNSGLKPSIETAMHFVLPHRVVIHIHSISAITWAVQRNCRSLLRERLEAFRWCWIRYAWSGAPLAAAIKASLRFSPDIFILANHGLVIGADTCEEAMLRLQEVEKSLAVGARTIREPDLARLENLALGSNYRLPDAHDIHSLATDDLSTAIVSGGILYPCQAIFLGRRTPVLAQQELLGRFPLVSQFQITRPPALLVKGQGVLVARDVTRSECEMLVGLSHVARRLSPNTRIAYLPEISVDQLLNSGVYRDSEPSPKMAARAASAAGNDSSRMA